jgi:hypothetical protein
MIEKTVATSRLTHRFFPPERSCKPKIGLAARIVLAPQPRASGGKQEATVQVIPDAVFRSTNGIV